MEAAPTKEAAKKRRFEKWLTATGTSPVSQPGGQEEVSDKSNSEKKAGNEKQDLNLDHRQDEEKKDHATKAAIKSPGVCVLWIYPDNVRLVQNCFQRRYFPLNVNLSLDLRRDKPTIRRFIPKFTSMRSSRSDQASRKFAAP
jgi:hypothetical protein